jgi:hypothetical protein
VDHVFGLEVPDGGSACSKCRWVSEDKKSCGNDYFVDWRKSLESADPHKLPAPADRYCCDVFQAQEA